MAHPMQHYGNRKVGIEGMAPHDVALTHTTAEYRLVVDKGFAKTTYVKKDLAHAKKGLADAIRDFQRYTPPLTVAEAWVEMRLVTTTGWEKM